MADVHNTANETANEIAHVRRVLAVRMAGRTVAALISVGACGFAAEARGADQQGLPERLAAARSKAEAASDLPGSRWRLAQADPKGAPRPVGRPEFANWGNK